MGVEALERNVLVALGVGLTMPLSNSEMVSPSSK
jgi:hypothetical protein